MENLENKIINSPEEMKKEEKKFVPDEEISEKFSRSGGRGGQNVNKLSTKAEVRWNVDASMVFTPEEKEKIKDILGKRINKEGELIVVSQEERSQMQNRERAIERLNKLVEAALIPEKERKPTKPTKASKERRLEEKKRIGEKKKQRSEKPKINDY
jgi:ribosome-associated protein